MTKRIFDEETEKWFENTKVPATTVMRCEKCGLFYKPSLGHKCEVKPSKAEYVRCRNDT